MSVGALPSTSIAGGGMPDSSTRTVGTRISRAISQPPARPFSAPATCRECSRITARKETAHASRATSKACDSRHIGQLGAAANTTVEQAQNTLSVTEASSSSARPPPLPADGKLHRKGGEAERRKPVRPHRRVLVPLSKEAGLFQERVQGSRGCRAPPETLGLRRRIRACGSSPDCRLPRGAYGQIVSARLPGTARPAPFR